VAGAGGHCDDRPVTSTTPASHPDQATADDAAAQRSGLPEGRSVPAADRYTKPDQPAAARIRVDGDWWPGEVMAYNGPRVHVVFVRDGGRYRRWVDAADVEPTDDGAAGAASS
jgi:hypothetical protein